ncbi:MAG: glycosyltransferase family 2 protein [Limisphaerales bacterium]
MTSPYPKISIVIPSFNAAQTIERALRSLVAQDYPNLELLLVDGGSQDNTLQIAQSYSQYFSKIISEKDRGQPHALNKGFKLATGEIFAWLCADDELAPGALWHVVELFQKNPEATLLTGGCTRIFSDGTIIHTAPQADLWKRISYLNGIEQPSTFWKAEIHPRAGQLDESYHFAFDCAWWNQVKISGANLITTNRILSHYHFSDTNKTSRGGTPLVREMYRVIKQYGPLHGYLADIYFFLYRHFDLHGYYDRPPAGPKIKRWIFKNTLKLLVKIFGKELIYSYNWNFASKQERNLCWYK